jgi:hypothetical protein
LKGAELANKEREKKAKKKRKKRKRKELLLAQTCRVALTFSP